MVTAEGHTEAGAADVAGSGDEPAAGVEGELEELIGLLFRLTGHLRQRFTDRSADLDLSFAQAMALRELGRPLPMRALAQRLCCDASNVTGIVDRLEERGLVERRVAPDDRRVKHLVLTDAGRALRRLHRDGFTVDLPLLDDLSAGDRRLLTDLLRRAVGEGQSGVGDAGLTAMSRPAASRGAVDGRDKDC